jgi:hypothetical protein
MVLLIVNFSCSITIGASFFSEMLVTRWAYHEVAINRVSCAAREYYFSVSVT